MSAADEKTGLRRGQNRCADFFRRNEKTFLTFVLFSDKIHLACGGIAQLGERLNGIQEVSGSIPLISTTKRDIRSDVSFHFKIEWNAESRRNGQLPADYEWRCR